MTSEWEVLTESIGYFDPFDYDNLDDYLMDLYDEFPEEFIDAGIDTLIENWEIANLEN